MSFACIVHVPDYAFFEWNRMVYEFIAFWKKTKYFLNPRKHIHSLYTQHFMICEQRKGPLSKAPQSISIFFLEIW